MHRIVCSSVASMVANKSAYFVFQLTCTCCFSLAKAPGRPSKKGGDIRAIKVTGHNSSGTGGWSLKELTKTDKHRKRPC